MFLSLLWCKDFDAKNRRVVVFFFLYHSSRVYIMTKMTYTFSSSRNFKLICILLVSATSPFI